MNDSISENLPPNVTLVDEAFGIGDGPWRLGVVEVEEESWGFTHKQLYNVLYTDYLTGSMKCQPNLKMKYELPFWRLNEASWGMFKKRVIGFSKSEGKLPTIFDEPLEELRKRILEENNG